MPTQATREHHWEEVTRWYRREASEAAVLQSIDAAMAAEDPSWRSESWNQNAVPKGAVLQPLYALMSDFLEDKERHFEDDFLNDERHEQDEHEHHQLRAGRVPVQLLRKPLELKVQVLFGEVVGACLNTHPMYLWVTRDGGVIQWDPATPGLLKKGHGLWQDLPGPPL